MWRRQMKVVAAKPMNKFEGDVLEKSWISSSFLLLSLSVVILLSGCGSKGDAAASNASKEGAANSKEETLKIKIADINTKSVGPSSNITDIYDNTLPYPRDVTSPEFYSLYNQIQGHFEE